MKRRSVLAGARSPEVLQGTLWRKAFGNPAQPGASPYGELLAVDSNGLRLPHGFASRVVGESGREVAGDTWHDAPDEDACFTLGDGWVYLSNSEVDDAAVCDLRTQGRVSHRGQTRRLFLPVHL